MPAALRSLARPFVGAFRDLLPILLVVGFFQAVVFRQPFADPIGLLVGMVLVVLGLGLFVIGLDLGLFPVGERMANDFARKGSLPWLLAFAFCLGFGTTFAEPALIAIGAKAADLALPDGDAAARDGHALTLRFTVAVSVGVALVIGVVRILKGWPIHYLIAVGYVAILIATPFSPPSIVAVAYDAGGVTTSTITVPLTAALGVGLASSIQGRNPLLDGFGLIAFASLTPVLFVLLFGIAQG